MPDRKPPICPIIVLGNDYEDLEMNFFPVKRLLAGVELASDNIKSALIFKNGNNFSIKQLTDVQMPPQTLKPSFKKENIINLELFHDCLQKSCREIKVKKKK